MTLNLDDWDYLDYTNGTMQRERDAIPWSGRLGQGAINGLFLLGGLFLSLGVLYAGYVALQNWTLGRDQFLAVDRMAALPVPTITSTATPTFTPTPLPTPTVTPTPTPPPRPVQIRIPAIGVKSAVVEVPLVENARTGITDWAIDRLFRPGQKDLVGHLAGTSLPGQPGNAVLGGHNYGVGFNGVFVHLGRLRKGDRVVVVNEHGEQLTYQVVSTERVKWRRQTFKELVRHLEYLAATDDERLTLMSCGGANIEPFPERIYVVAKPVE